jgi:hypothetical protein
MTSFLAAFALMRATGASTQVRLSNASTLLCNAQRAYILQRTRKDQ